MKEYLFSYGTLQQQKIQLELFGRTLNGTTDELNGYKTATIELKDAAIGESETHLIAVVSTEKDDCIKGTVLEMTEEELMSADKYEPEEYKRVKVVLQSGKESWVYEAAVN